MHQVNFTPGAENDLSKLDSQIAQRVLKRLRWLAENFDTINPEPLSGKWRGVFKLRVGDYRVLYTFDQPKRIIIVHYVKHRREVYKDAR
jgi:mRNA interferase RelE/StbE